MHDYQREFLEFALRAEVLRFGRFTLKSGRISPYFFNSGLFNTGQRLRLLGQCYAQALQARRIEYDMLFGPAYKGIPLVTALAIALAERSGQDVPYAFNRKETKDHGEGGQVIGTPLVGRVLIVDDVISAGTSVRQSVEIIRGTGAQACGVAIALDRQERGTGLVSAVHEVEKQFDLPVISIVNLDTLVSYLSNQPGLEANLAQVCAYRDQYGA
jgi:orotate phosphoribosyltransferase